MSLDEKTRARIRAEELFREEVRSELTRGRKPSAPSGWEVLNSNLVLWLLGVLIVTLLIPKVSGDFARAAEVARQKVASERAVWKLGFEARERLNRLEAALSRIHDANSFAVFLIESHGEAYLPEFRNRDMTSILYELESLRSGASRESVEKLIRSVKEKEAKLGSLTAKWDPQSAERTVHEFHLLLDGLGISRR